MKDFRSGGSSVAPHRLRVFWIPQDFDADDEVQRGFVAQMLHENVSRDILMNVVFGNLTSEDTRFFVRTGGLPGLHLAVLYAISTSQERYSRPKDLADQLGVSQGAIRERLLRLLGCGFLSQFGGGATLARATLKGRVFLDLCGELWRQTSEDVRMGEELLQVLRLLDMRYAPSALDFSRTSLRLAGPLLNEVPEMATGRLIATIEAAVQRWGIDLKNIDHSISKEEESIEKFGSVTGQLVSNLRKESDLYFG
jgi:hypothetical protein